mmetsp:Transcript_128137/g.369082  ORF Transcript_128137/g.369082 Transcript_128137/m.369082 type:complete len:274 (-) Transcript_128137:416-1237(-)
MASSCRRTTRSSSLRSRALYKQPKARWKVSEPSFRAKSSCNRSARERMSMTGATAPPIPPAVGAQVAVDVPEAAARPPKAPPPPMTVAAAAAARVVVATGTVTRSAEDLLMSFEMPPVRPLIVCRSNAEGALTNSKSSRGRSATSKLPYSSSSSSSPASDSSNRDSTQISSSMSSSSSSSSSSSDELVHVRRLFLFLRLLPLLWLLGLSLLPDFVFSLPWLWLRLGLGLRSQSPAAHRSKPCVKLGPPSMSAERISPRSSGWCLINSSTSPVP